VDNQSKETIPPKITIQNKEPIDMTRNTSPKSSVIVIVGIVIIVLMGVATGFLLANGDSTGGKTEMAGGGGMVVTDRGEIERVVGIEDTKGKDEAEGKLVEGGIKGEGSHHLERPGGPSQNVYLVSSMIDLDKYIGQNIHVWGETNTAQTAGWFMDVVKLEVMK
jgi:hypothetical protein